MFLRCFSPALKILTLIMISVVLFWTMLFFEISRTIYTLIIIIVVLLPLDNFGIV